VLLTNDRVAALCKRSVFEKVREKKEGEEMEKGSTGQSKS
jgi:hypothetical protein